MQIEIEHSVRLLTRVRIAVCVGLLGVVGLSSSGCRALREPTSSDEPPSAPGPGLKLSDASALMAALGPGPAQIPEPLGLGRLELDADERVLILGGAPVVRLAGAGEPCTVAPSEVPLVVFEGPEALLLYAGVRPRFVGLDEDSQTPRCWSVADPVGLVGIGEQVEMPEPGTGLVRVDYYYEDDESGLPVVATARVELRADSPGEEQLELVFADGELGLVVDSADGGRLLAWAEDLSCESLDAELWVSHLGDGVVFELVYDCDDCVVCEHGWSNTRVDLHMAWSGPGPVHLASLRSSSRYGEDPGSHGEDHREDYHQRSWRLGAGLVHHERVEHEFETEEYWCTDTESSERCCSRTSWGSSSDESWEVELEGRAGFMRTIEAQSDESEPEVVCEP